MTTANHSVPDQIGPYKILEPLGQGGMGIVYLARHAENDSLAALKTVLLPRKTFLASMRREIHALFRLRHPNIVKILDHGILNGLPWYAMEVLKGWTLGQWRNELAGEMAKSQASSTSSLNETATLAPAPKPKKTRVEPASGPPDNTLFVQIRKMDDDRTVVGAAAEKDPSSAEPSAAPRRKLAEDAGRLAGSGSAEWWTESLTSVEGLRGAKSAQTLAQPLGSTPLDRAPDMERLPPSGMLDGTALEAILGMIHHLCAPLAYLHGEGLVHRDLKPGNVLVLDNDMPVLVDFGLLSRFTDALSRETLDAGTPSVGTLNYMAPEQILGQRVDARADLYSVGCIFYELLTGSPPFSGGSRNKVIQDHLSKIPRPPSTVVVGIPGEVDELVLRLLSKDPRHRFGYATDLAKMLENQGVPPMAPPAPKARSYLYLPGLAGRDAELGRLIKHLEHLKQGNGGLLLLGGESGVGKTRLLNELRRVAIRQRVEVLIGECLDSEEGPLRAFHKILEEIGDLCRQGGFARTKKILGRRGNLLSLYEKSLETLPGQEEIPPPADLPPDEARIRLFRALLETMSAVAELRQGLLLLFDDLQWADELTLGFLEFAHRSGELGKRRLLIIGDYRSEEKTAGLDRLLEFTDVEAMELARLREPAIVAMVGEMLAMFPPPENFGKALARHSEGNPFFVAEYLRTAVEERLLWRDERGSWQVAESTPEIHGTQYEGLALPSSLRELILRRFEGLSPPATELCQAAAVIGREVSLPLVERMVELEERLFLEASEELRRRKVLEEDSEGELRFNHDKLRETAYTWIDNRQRPLLHRAAATAMEAVLQANRKEHLAEMGQHWEKGGEKEQAANCYLEAAREAKKRAAYREAEELYRATLRLAPPSSADTVMIRNELGHDVLRDSGKLEEALTEHKEAIRLATELGDDKGRARSCLYLGHIHSDIGDMDRAETLFKTTLAIAHDLGEPRLEANALLQLGMLRRDQGRMEQARSIYENSLRAAKKAADPGFQARILNGLGILHSEQGRMEESRNLHKAAAGLAKRHGRQHTEGYALLNLANVEGELGRVESSLTLHEAALRISRVTADPRLEGIELINLAGCHLPRGNIKKALKFSKASLKIARDLQDHDTECHALGTLAHCHRELGSLEAARQHYEAAMKIALRLERPRLEGSMLRETGELALVRGTLDESETRLLRALAIARRIQEPHHESYALASVVELRLEQGRLEAAKLACEAAMEITKKIGEPELQADLLKLLARQARLAGGDLKQARSWLQKAEATFVESGSKLFLAKLYAELGHLELAMGILPRSSLHRIRKFLVSFDCGPKSDLGQRLDGLERAAAAFDKGEHQLLYRGELLEDLSPALRQRLTREIRGAHANQG